MIYFGLVEIPVPDEAQSSIPNRGDDIFVIFHLRRIQRQMSIPMINAIIIFVCDIKAEENQIAKEEAAAAAGGRVAAPAQQGYFRDPRTMTRPELFHSLAKLNYLDCTADSTKSNEELAARLAGF